MAALTPYQMLIDGEWVDSSRRQNVRKHQPDDGSKPWAEDPRGDVPRMSIKAVKRRATAHFQRRTVVQDDAPQNAASMLRKLGRSPCLDRSEDLGRTETSRHRKDVQGDPLAGRNTSPTSSTSMPACADKVHGETLPIDKPDHRTRLHPRANRLACIRRRSALELATVPGRGQDRTGAGRRQHGRAEGLRTCLRRHARIRPVDRGGRLPSRRRQHRHRPW